MSFGNQGIWQRVKSFQLNTTVDSRVGDLPQHQERWLCNKALEKCFKQNFVKMVSKGRRSLMRESHAALIEKCFKWDFLKMVNEGRSSLTL